MCYEKQVRYKVKSECREKLDCGNIRKQPREPPTYDAGLVTR